MSFFHGIRFKVENAGVRENIRIFYLHIHKIVHTFASVKQRRPLPPSENDLRTSDVDSVAATMSGVRFLRTMILTLICAGLAGGLLASTQHYRRKWKELKAQYNERCAELTNALEDVAVLNSRIESYQKYNADFVERIGEYKHLLTTGGRNLKTNEWLVSFASQEPMAGISVIGQDTINSDLCFVIKDFHFNPNDPEDREFAIRQAEELIEIIQNF